MKSEFVTAITQLAAEKGVPREMVMEAIQQALVSAYKQHEEDSRLITAEIDNESGEPHVYHWLTVVEDIPDDVGAKNCVAGFKKIIGYAEKKKVNLCLEMLNSRVDVEMKGHPGYQGDHTDYCIEIIKQVGSPRMKLLFDIYHVQIMDGDVISRIRQHAGYIGHIHTAGNPGRAELDDTQEINYPPIMRKSAIIIRRQDKVTHVPLDAVRCPPLHEE